MGRLIALIAALAAALLIARTEERLPAPAPSTAPATQFSAERAMADVAVMARTAHPIGTPQNARVRDHLLSRMAALGLSPQVRPGVAVWVPRRASNVVHAGRVENVVGILPGRDRAAPAVALMAHYDSVPNSPGAADDIAGVASALEIARAIQARGVPARDLMLIITDGEEPGLMGANAFFQRDPLAKRVGLLLNMEARGSGGRAQMFQTSPDNGQLIELLRRSGVRPASSSLTVFIYQNMPNDTDMTESLRAGVPGMNYAFIGRQFDYHSPTSTPAWLDKGSLQDLGQEVLGTASAAAFAPALPGKAAQAVYGGTFEGLTPAYPSWGGWLLLAIAASLLAVGVRRARRIEGFPWTDALRGAGALLFATLGAVALLQFARHATGVGFGYVEQRDLLAQVTRWEWAVGLIGLGFVLVAIAELARGRRIVALAPLLAGAACSAFGGFDPVGLVAGGLAAAIGAAAFGRPVSRAGGWTGVLIAGLVLATVAQALAPQAAYVLAWPLVLAALAAALTAGGAQRGPLALAVLGVAAAVGLGWLGGLGHGVYIALDLMPLLGLPLLLAALVVWPIAQPADGAPPGRLVGAVLVAAGFAVTLWVRLADPHDVRHPQASYVVYQVDQDAGRAWRISATPDLPAWSRGVLSADGQKIAKHRDWLWSERVDAAPAPMLAATPPPIALTRLPDGRLSLHAESAAGAGMLSLRLTPTIAATVEQIAGVPVRLPVKPGETLRVRWETGAGGVDVVIRPAGRGTLQVRYLNRLDNWPVAAPLPPRPADVAPFNDSDTTYVVGTRRFAW
jgi:hypothetical protein